jgi:hypothetical protein
MSEDNQTFIIFYNLIPGGFSPGRTYTRTAMSVRAVLIAGFKSRVVLLLKIASPSRGLLLKQI